LIARSIVSRGIEAAFARSTAWRSREFDSRSAPLLAATMISLASFPSTRPLVAAFSVFPACFH